MVISFALIYIVVYPSIPEDLYYLTYSNSGLFVICMILWVVAWRSDPGRLCPDPNLDFVDLLE